ncbi:hypothetical protein C7475_1011060 [Chitinophaga sp. S165]|nr:hypothetical protein C7475_1011060 [Chitinophaga sp. S165]
MNGFFLVKNILKYALIYQLTWIILIYVLFRAKSG